MRNDPNIQIILEQLQTLLLFLERPVVERQLAAFAVVTVLAWLLSDGLWYLIGRRYSVRLKARLN